MLEEIKGRAQTEGRRESRPCFYVGGQHNMVALSIKNSLAAATNDDHTGYRHATLIFRIIRDCFPVEKSRLTIAIFVSLLS